MSQLKLIHFVLIVSFVIIVYSEEGCEGYKNCYDICGRHNVNSCSIKITSDGGNMKRVKICGDGRPEVENDRTNNKTKINIECSYKNETSGDENNFRSVSTQTRNVIITINE